MSFASTPRGTADLSAWLAWQESAHPKSWDLGLARIGQVWQALGAPRIAKHVISIAGTNGKGSCVAWAEAMCVAANVSVGSFSSPHLLDYRERIRFDGQKVEPAQLCAAFDAIDVARADISLTYFEWSALAAFYLMAQRQIEIAVLEVGLGGRLDAVNLLDADIAIFTRIGLDHQQWLGETVAEIAAEKAGIMRKGQKMICADPNPPAALHAAAKALGASLLVYGKDFAVQVDDQGLHLQMPTAAGEQALSFTALPLPQLLKGAHQYGHFAALAVALSDWITLDQQILSQALHQAYNPARLMLKAGSPRYVIDVAHNQDSAEVLANFLCEIRRPDERVHIVCGMLADKDHGAIVQALSALSDAWYFASLSGARGSNGQAVADEVSAILTGKKVQAFADVLSALQAAEQAARAEDMIVVMGSFVTVNEVLMSWNKHE